MSRPDTSPQGSHNRTALACRIAIRGAVPEMEQCCNVGSGYAVAVPSRAIHAFRTDDLPHTATVESRPLRGLPRCRTIEIDHDFQLDHARRTIEIPHDAFVRRNACVFAAARGRRAKHTSPDAIWRFARRSRSDARRRGEKWRI